jgi:hypothetical protein
VQSALKTNKRTKCSEERSVIFLVHCTLIQYIAHFTHTKKPAPKKKETLLSCPFCGLAFEDVTLHLDSCSGVQGKPAQPAPITPPTPVPFNPSPSPTPSPSLSPSPTPSPPATEEREVVQEPPTTPPKPQPQVEQPQWKALPKVENEPTLPRQNSSGWIKPQVQANEKLKTSGKDIPVQEGTFPILKQLFTIELL